MNKYLVISGASEGIGLDITRVFLDSGYRVLGLDKENSMFEGVDGYSHLKIDLKEILVEGGAAHQAVLSHIETNVSELVLINNAAAQKIGDFNQLEQEVWQEVFEVNLFAPVALVRLLESRLKKAKASIINLSSIHASQTKPGFSAYAASKAALESLTRSLSIEFASHGVRVNAVAPAAISTSMLKEGFANDLEGLARLKSMHPAGKVGSTKELAHFIKFVAELSDNFLNGAVLPYDGGISGVLSDPGCFFTKKIEV